MTKDVGASYDAMAELYATVNLGDLDRDTPDRGWLDRFAEQAASRDGLVADLGCGPGHVVSYLTGLGLTVTGYDISPGQLAQARAAFPDLPFRLADISALDIADETLGGIVSRYSLIHMDPSRIGQVFDEWFRVLQPGAPALVSFFASSTPEAHGTPFDHAVVTAHELFPGTITTQLRDAGFDRIEVGLRGPLEGERLLDHGTILARKCDS